MQSETAPRGGTQPPRVSDHNSGTLHFFTATAARVLVATTARLSAFGHLYLTAAIRVRAVVAFSLF
jgi:hypothetical protein